MLDDKPSLEQLREFATSRGGRCLSEEASGAGSAHRWTCATGHEFEASPRLLIEGGYWCPSCFPTLEDPSYWDWDVAAETDPLLARFHNKS